MASIVALELEPASKSGKKNFGRLTTRITTGNLICKSGRLKERLERRGASEHNI